MMQKGNVEPRAARARKTPSGARAASGIAVLCDAQGNILKVVHDGIGLAPRLAAGRAFVTAIGGSDEANVALAQQFIEALRRTGFAMGWELMIMVAGRQSFLSFAGGATHQGFLIIGEVARSDVAYLVEELMQINNETVNALRSTTKETALAARAQSAQDSELLADFSHLNNALVTAQREIARKNGELACAYAALEQAHAALKQHEAELVEVNARLDKLATTDGLTGLKNHRAFQEKLAEEVARSVRYGTSLSLVLLDVNKFKQYNDTYGHPSGDVVLKTVAALLREQARVTDFPARYGGEEFVVVLPGTDAEGALVMAERMRTAIAGQAWPERAVTASFGAATFGATLDTPVALIAAADQALYHAKESGRNRVAHARSLL